MHPTDAIKQMDLEPKLSEEFRLLAHENQTLQQKAHQIDRDFYRLVKSSQKPVLNNFTQAMFRPGNRTPEARAPLDLDHITQQLRARQQKLASDKQSLDLRDCTFHPQINARTQELLGGHYVPAHKRPLPRRPQAFKEDEAANANGSGPQARPRVDSRRIRETMSVERLDRLVGEQTAAGRNCLTDEEWQDRVAGFDPEKGEGNSGEDTLDLVGATASRPAKKEKGKRRYNSKFYEEKYRWKSEVYQRLNKEKALQIQKEFASTREGAPLKLDHTKSKSKEDEDATAQEKEKKQEEENDFFARLKKDLLRSKEAMAKLEKKYYGHSFQPQINLNNTTPSQYFTASRSPVRQPKSTTNINMNTNGNAKVKRSATPTSARVERKNSDLFVSAPVSKPKAVKKAPNARTLPISNSEADLPLKKQVSVGEVNADSDLMSKAVVRMYFKKNKKA